MGCIPGLHSGCKPTDYRLPFNYSKDRWAACPLLILSGETAGAADPLQMGFSGRLFLDCSWAEYGLQFGEGDVQVGLKTCAPMHTVTKYSKPFDTRNRAGNMNLGCLKVKPWLVDAQVAL